MSRVLRIAGYSAGGLVLVLVLLVAGVYGVSGRDLNATYSVEVAPLRTVGPPGSALVERGEHIAVTRGCTQCHAEDGGGLEFADDPALGVLWTSNLTSGEGGIAGTYSDADWDRSIRHGVGPSGKPLIFMPSHEFWALGDEDLAALIAYYRSLEPVDRVRPRSRPGPVARVLHLTGRMKLVPAKLIDHAAPRPEAPPEAPSVDYGAYLATGCTGCHNERLSGGKISGGEPGWPEAANLTPDETGIGGWTQEDFVRALREGVRPDGSAIDPAMPVESTRRMTDTELQALYAYLMSLEPTPYGSR